MGVWGAGDGGKGGGYGVETHKAGSRRGVERCRGKRSGGCAGAPRRPERGKRGKAHGRRHGRRPPPLPPDARPAVWGGGEEEELGARVRWGGRGGGDHAVGDTRLWPPAAAGGKTGVSTAEREQATRARPATAGGWPRARAWAGAHPGERGQRRKQARAGGGGVAEGGRRGEEATRESQSTTVTQSPRAISAYSDILWPRATRPGHPPAATRLCWRHGCGGPGQGGLTPTYSRGRMYLCIGDTVQYSTYSTAHIETRESKRREGG